MSRTGRAAKGFVTSIFQFASLIAVQALLAPIVLKMAGRETLGAYSAVMQVLGFIALTDFMGSWTLERFLGQASGLDDGGERFRCVFTTVRTMFLFCVLAYSLLVVIFSFFVGRLFHLSTPVEHQAQYALWVIAVWVIGVCHWLHTRTLPLPHRIWLPRTSLAHALAPPARSVLWSSCCLEAACLASCSPEPWLKVSDIFYRMRFKKMNPHLMPSWGIPDKALLKEMLAFGSHTFIVNLGSGLVFNSGNMIAGLTSGASVASSFYTTQMPTTTAYNMMKRFSDSATPAVNELWGRRDVEKLRNALLRITRLLMTLTLPLAVGALLFNRDLVTTWVGPRQYAGTLLTASLAGFCIIASIQRMAVDYSFVFGWMRLLTATSLLQGIANFGLAFLFAKLFGLGGIMLALVLVLLPQTIILWYRVGNFLKVNVVALYGECFLRRSSPGCGSSGELGHGSSIRENPPARISPTVSGDSSFHFRLCSACLPIYALRS